MSDVNKEVIRRVIIEVFGGGDIEAVDELYSQEYVDHSLQHGLLFGVNSHLDGFKRLLNAVRAGLSNLTTEVQLMVAEGEFVACVMRGVGIHTGPFMGVAPTGKEVEVIDYHFFRLQDGKIREHWNQYNTLQIMQQLGVVPRI